MFKTERVLRAIIILVSIISIGVLGYVVIERAHPWDALYMTVITLTTVGYREVFPLSRLGEAWTMLLLLGGIGLILYVATELGRAVLEVELDEVLGSKRRSRMIEGMHHHEIVCGFGRMGEAVVDELRRGGHAVIVIESNSDKVNRLHELGIPTLAGDATTESTLRAAGIDQARGLVACLPDDAHNVYTVLTARSMSQNLFIVARASEGGAEARIIRAGANRVVNPYNLGGARLAHLLVKPTVVEFLEFSLSSTGQQLGLEQARLTPENPLVGRTLAEADLRRNWGIGVVAIQRGQTLLPNPEPDVRFQVGDVLVILGTTNQLTDFERSTAIRGPRPAPVHP